MNMDNNSRKCHPQFGCRPHGNKGPSSFWMHDPKVIFDELNLKTGMTFLDLGCGTGDYSLYAAKIVGECGTVYAVDKWEDLVTNLVTTADSKGLESVIGIISDITVPLPLNNHCVDVCFISTVLHTLDVGKTMVPLLAEIRRVLKPIGRLVIIECKKEDMPFGPPKHMRLSQESLKELITQHGFENTSFVDLGVNYLLQFELSKK